jgi:hypothetical protein
MATENGVPQTSDAAILARVIRPDDDSLSPAAAQAFLTLRFEQRDLDRMHELVTKNQDDALTVGEKAEMENFRRVSYLLDLLHSKARRSLKRHQEVL